MIIDMDDPSFKTIFFPGGEPHVEISNISDYEEVYVFAKVRDTNDALMLSAVLSALDVMKTKPVVHLFIPYFPGARQDRVQEGFPLTVNIYSNMFWQPVTTTVCDIHSSKAMQLSYATGELPFNTFISDLITESYDVIICPDKGAVDRAKEIAAILKISTVINCTKKRDPITGALSGFDVPVLNPELRYLIADDICDGGGTFVGILNEIRKQSQAHIATHVALYVTHGIFSKGFTPLAGFDKIYTTDSWYVEIFPEELPLPVKSINLFPYYMKWFET